MDYYNGGGGGGETSDAYVTVRQMAAHGAFSLHEAAATTATAPWYRFTRARRRRDGNDIEAAATSC
jgi:hypothetical protein